MSNASRLWRAPASRQRRGQHAGVKFSWLEICRLANGFQHPWIRGPALFGSAQEASYVNKGPTVPEIKARLAEDAPGPRFTQ